MSAIDDHAPRLTPEELRAWRGMLDATQEIRRGLAVVIDGAASLSEADFVVLLGLVEADGYALRPSELAEALDWDRSRVSHHIARMEKRNLITREPCATDSRGAVIRIADEGLDTIRRATGPHLRAIKTLFAEALTPAQIDALLEIVASLRAHAAATRPTDPEPEPDPDPATITS